MFKAILTAIDLEHREQSREIVAAAKANARLSGCEVYFVTVVPAAPPIISQFLHENYEQLASGEAQKALAELADEAGLDADDKHCIVRFGTVYDEVIAAAEATGADLLVIGSHKPNFSDYLLGSNAARVVRHCGCSVLVIR